VKVFCYSNPIAKNTVIAAWMLTAIKLRIFIYYQYDIGSEPRIFPFVLSCELVEQSKDEWKNP